MLEHNLEERRTMVLMVRMLLSLFLHLSLPSLSVLVQNKLDMELNLLELNLKLEEMPWAIEQDMYMYMYFALNPLLAPDLDLCQGTMHVELDLSLEGDAGQR